jgi:capsular exopolysaccharide synthesis family protein
MSRLFEALSNVEAKRRQESVAPLAAGFSTDGRSERAAAETLPAESAPESERKSEPAGAVSLTAISSNTASHSANSLNAVPFSPHTDEKIRHGGRSRSDEAFETQSVSIRASEESRLVALTEPNGLSAEKFRALVARLDHMRKQGDLRSLQVTSSVINEGKTVVAANLAVTLARYSGAKTLLVEGDLHRPTLAALLGLDGFQGICDWWPGPDQELTEFVLGIDDMPLWLLPSGRPRGSPSDILRSDRFAKAFLELASRFDWVVVDSTPMLPIVDVNLWSKLLDGTLLVVREGMAPIKGLKQGLLALDHPKLVGVVMNETSGDDRVNYGEYYYSSHKPQGANRAE